jgi:predicted O-methyltransferase YrrM
MNTFRRQFLESLRVSSLVEKVPIITEKNAQFLHWLCRSRGVKKILEIGCADGYSTIWLTDAVVDKNIYHKNPSASPLVSGDLLTEFSPQVVSIEYSAWHYERAKKNIKTVQLDDVIELKFGDAQNILPTLEIDQFDLIFVDGRKNCYAQFFELCKPLLTSDGCMIFDDVIKFKHKMEDFYEVMQNQNNFCWQVIPIDTDDGVMIVWEKV